MSNATGLAVGQTVSGNNVIPGSIIVGISGTTLNLSMPASYGVTGTVTSGLNTVSVTSATGLGVGQLVVGTNLPVGTTIAGASANPATITLSNLVSGTNSSPTPEPLTIFTGTISAPATVIGAVTGGSNSVTSLSITAGLAVGQAIAGTGIPSGTTITSVNSTAGTLTMSNASTGTNTSPLLLSLTITAISITVPSTPLAIAANAYYGAFAGVTGGGTTLPGIVTVGNNVVSAIPPLTGLAIGQPIFGTYIPSGSTVAVIGSGAATATNPGVGTVTISNPAVGSSFNTESIVVGVPTSALLSIGQITPGVALTATTTATFTSPTSVALKIPSAVTVTVGRSIITISAPATVSGTQTLIMLTGDIMDVEPFDPGTAALAAAGPSAITIPPSTYSTSGPTNPVVYQGFFNTAGTGTATANTPAGLPFARSFGQTLSVLLGSTQFNPPTFQGGFFPVGVAGPINVNTDQ